MDEKGLYRRYIKRMLDIVIAFLSLLALSPLMLLIALLVRARLGSPVLFKQPRPGKNERIFYLCKFRSMTDEAGEDGRLLPDAKRLTKFGRFMRAGSLDELPQLINILRGDMSFVGPRPLSIYYLPHYPAEFRKRHAVRPGLTGLAQVNGRNSLPWDERFRADIQYVQSISLAQDAGIMRDTFLKVLRHADVSIRGTDCLKDYGCYSVLKEHYMEGKQWTGMTYAEIGSYFWLAGNKMEGRENGIAWLPVMEDGCFTFSGRSAIDLALRDILDSRRVGKAYVPSYCCVSMLQAFLDRGIKTVFYQVGYKEGQFTYQLPRAGSGDVVLIMSYFGLGAKQAHAAISQLHAQGAVIIQDITHSLLREEPACAASDYVVASLRKWFAVPTGGWLGKRRGKLSGKPTAESNETVREKIAAMKEKYDYLTGSVKRKESFLLAQAKFENELIHADRLLKIDGTSENIIRRVDAGQVIDKRRRNAALLIKGLKDLEGEVLSFPQIDLSRDTPIFVPIFLKTEDRDSLKKFLSARGIYCPVHWPETMGAPQGIRENELSLICDQRYGEGDMHAIVAAVHEWHETLLRDRKAMMDGMRAAGNEGRRG